MIHKDTASCDDCICTLPLTRLAVGQAGCIRKIDAPDGEQDRLKSMGLCVGRNVVVARTGEPLLLKVFGSRLGVSRTLAAGIWVEQKTLAGCSLQETPTPHV